MYKFFLFFVKKFLNDKKTVKNFCIIFLLRKKKKHSMDITQRNQTNTAVKTLSVVRRSNCHKKINP